MVGLSKNKPLKENISDLELQPWPHYAPAYPPSPQSGSIRTSPRAGFLGDFTKEWVLFKFVVVPHFWFLFTIYLAFSQTQFIELFYVMYVIGEGDKIHVITFRDALRIGF